MRTLKLSGIKRQHAAANGRFFSASNTRYWSSCYYYQTITARSGEYTLFVTSETPFPEEPNTRRFTVRRFDHATADILDAPDFMECETLADALQRMSNLAKQL